MDHGPREPKVWLVWFRYLAEVIQLLAQLHKMMQFTIPPPSNPYFMFPSFLKSWRWRMPKRLRSQDILFIMKPHVDIKLSILWMFSVDSHSEDAITSDSAAIIELNQDSINASTGADKHDPARISSANQELSSTTCAELEECNISDTCSTFSYYCVCMTCCCALSVAWVNGWFWRCLWMHASV